MATKQGSIILLVGPSCAGKSTPAKAGRERSAEPYLVQSLDGLFAARPDAWGGGGEHARDGFYYDWIVPQAEGAATVRRIGYGPVGLALLKGFHRAVAAYAEAGVNV